MSGLGGLCLTFDDVSVDDWLAADALFARYGARATFFVSHFHTLPSVAVEALRHLERRGHEIGCHSVNHLNAEHFLRERTPDDYLAIEVMPALKRMEAEGLRPTAWCYPFNASHPDLDERLLTLFKVLRVRADAAEDGLHPTVGNQKLRGRSIDLHVQGQLLARTLRDVEDELRMAQERRQTLVCYGHRISNHPVAHHHITAWGLECVLDAAVRLGLPFHTASEMA